jgi:hypothetical protein
MTMLMKDTGCYYGVHFGCLCAARDPSCRRCAERLTNAVNYELHTVASMIDTPPEENASFDATTEGKLGR